MSRYKKIRKYKKLASRAEALLDAEVAKPAGERDDALADEYALTVLYARERVDELSSVPVKAGTLRYEPRTLPLRKFAAAAAALLLVFCIGASFAQASGVRVWSALVDKKLTVKANVPKIFKVYYNKSTANYNNKSFYQFTPNRELKVLLKQKIKSDSKFDAFSVNYQ